MSEPPATLDWAVAGRPFPGESVSGDRAFHLALGDRDLFAAIDGLGHGPEAASAAERACDLIEEHRDAPLEELLPRVHKGLTRTRGVTMTLGSVARSGHLQWVGVGNVEAHLLRPDGHRLRLAASAVLYGGVVGYRLPSVRIGRADLQPGDVMVLATDGVAPQFIDGLFATPSLQQLVDLVLEQCARPNDDALVAAGRFPAGRGA